MNYPIYNRAADGTFVLPADGWYHLAPKGEFAHTESGLTQVLDEEAMAAMVNRFKTESQKPNFPGVLVDFDHFSYDPEKSSIAAGWITEMQNRSDGLWGQIRWSDEGQAALEKGRFRLISPTWLPRDVQRLDGQRIRPLRLDTAGLTNKPNLRGMAPLSNRAGAETLPADNTQTKGHKMKLVAQKLGLSADASEESVLAAVDVLQNRATGAVEAAKLAEAAIIPIKNRVTELEKTNGELFAVQVEADLGKYAPRFLPAKRDAWKASLIANRAGTLELLESLPEPKVETAAAGQAAMHNREKAQTPGSLAGGGNPYMDAVKAEIAGGKKRSEAFSIVSNRDPKLHEDWKAAGCPTA
jgi:phage I-like protein